MSNAVARSLSILGHPLLVLPAAVLLLTTGDGADAPRLIRIGLILGGLAMLVMAYSWWQVRRRRWSHVDASARPERRALNVFLLSTLLIGAGIAWVPASQPELALGLVLSAGLIAIALLTARWCRLSLHVAFVMFAAMLLVQLSWLACAFGLLFAGMVAWSRLALSRHTPRDLIVGAAAGALAGWAFWRIVPAVAG